MLLAALPAGIGRAATTGWSLNLPETTAPPSEVRLTAVPKSIGTIPQVELNAIPSVEVSVGSSNVGANRENTLKGVMNDSSRVQDWTTVGSWRPFEYLKWPFALVSTNANYKLWLGSPNPGTDFGQSFANELGSTIVWSVTAFSKNGVPLQSRQLHFWIDCSHPDIFPPFGGNLVNAGQGAQVEKRYSSTTVGRDYPAGGTTITYRNGESVSTPIRDFFDFGPRTFIRVGSQHDLEAGRNSFLLQNFWLRFTVWHSMDGVNTNAVKRVTLTTAPGFFIQRRPNSIELMILGQPGVAYQVMTTASLTPPATWTPATPGTLIEGNWITNQFTTNERARFWRLQ